MNHKQTGSARKRILLIALLFVCVIVSTVAVPLYARYVKKTDEIKNTFSHVDTTGPTIEEEFDKKVKENVKVSVGDTDYPVYVRVAIVLTWKKTIEVDGKEETLVYFEKPVENVDYTMTLNEDGGWVKIGDYYYYTKPVASGKETTVLIKTCTQDKEGPEEGYTLSVDIIAQTVQAVGYTDDTSTPAYQDAWGISQAWGDTAGD